MPLAIPELIWFALLLFAFALVYISRQFTHALFDPIIRVASLVPGLGKVLSSAIGAIESAITSALGSAEHAIDKAVGATWHQLSRLTEWMLREIDGLANGLDTIARFVAQALHEARNAFNITAGISRAISAVRHAVKTLEKEYHGIEHRVKTIEREIAHGIGHDLRIQVRALRDKVTTLVDKTIPAIRAAANGAEADVSALRQWVNTHVGGIGTSVFAGAVAIALSTLGLSWLRCKSNPFNNNRNACGLWGDLGDLLGLATAAIAAAEFEQLVREAQTLEKDVAVAIKTLWGLD